MDGFTVVRVVTLLKHRVSYLTLKTIFIVFISMIMFDKMETL
jgi:hypothetical protein